VPDLRLERARRETKPTGVVYELEGRDGKDFVEVEVGEDGEVLKIERNQEEDREEPKAMRPPAGPAAVNAEF
jgi:hypothetical protein